MDVDFELVDDETAKRLIRSKEDKKPKISPGLKGASILLVEDHPLNAEIAIKLLKKAGMDAHPAKPFDPQGLYEIPGRSIKRI